VQRLRQQATNGSSFGAPTEAEIEMAELVSNLMPAIEKLRLVSSGTEATMSAIRLARAFTGRTKILKFDGCYHGHSDGLLVKAGSGVATLSLPDSAGVPPAFARDTLTANYNDLESVGNIFSRYRKQIAAVIVEPICGNMGVILPKPGFLSGLRKLTKEYQTLLIFDEVITGFRVGSGGAQEIFKIKPDLTCLGKILGGGLPLAAFGGRTKIMDMLAPIGPVYQAGTLSGNPVAVAAGIATVELLTKPGTYGILEKKGKRLEDGFKKVLVKHRIRAAINRIGSMMTLFFGVDRVADPVQARDCDREKFARFFHGMLTRGIYLPPAPFEAMFISLAHSNADLDRTIAAFDDWAGEESVS
jgi:glutamate-1-semialdehyde 2,1-aminomutase